MTRRSVSVIPNYICPTCGRIVIINGAHARLYNIRHVMLCSGGHAEIEMLVVDFNGTGTEKD